MGAPRITVRKWCLFRTVNHAIAVDIRGFSGGICPMPTGVLRTVVDSGAGMSAARPKKPRNKDVRPREYLSEAEVDQLCKAAQKRGRYGHRDATMILMAYRHGLRVSELVALRWDQI